MTNASQTRLAYIAESTYGTTPTTPVFKNMRFTNESLNPNLTYVSSNEIRSDRNVADKTLVGSEAGGDVGFELSYGGQFDDFLEALLQGTWSSNVLINGTTTKSFTIEKTFAAVANQYHRLRGCMVNTMALNMKAKEIVTGSFGFLAKDFSSAQAIVSGATYTAANTNPVINAANNFASFSSTNLPTAASLMGLDLNITNNMNQQPVMGSIYSKGILSGQFNVSGNMDIYFDNQEALEAFIADTACDLNFTLGGASTKKYAFVIPKLKFVSVSENAGGNNQDVMAKIAFEAYYDGTSKALQITRTP